MHTLEAHQPDLSDLPASKLKRGNPPPGMRIGDEGPMGRILIAGEEGNGIIDDVAPLPVSNLPPSPLSLPTVSWGGPSMRREVEV